LPRQQGGRGQASDSSTEHRACPWIHVGAFPSRLGRGVVPGQMVPMGEPIKRLILHRRGVLP